MATPLPAHDLVDDTGSPAAPGRAHATTTTTAGTLLGVTPAPPTTDSADDDCTDYPGGGTSPEAHQRALDVNDTLKILVTYAAGAADAAPASLVEFDAALPNPAKGILVLIRVAAQIAALVYGNVLEEAETCRGNNTQTVTGDVLTDADQLYATGDTVLALDQQIAGLLDERVQALQGQVTTLQQVVEADNALVQTAVATAQTDTNTLNASLVLRQKSAIETDLAATTPPIADFLLPSSVGGYLDATPAGVKSVVHGLVSSVTAAGVAFDPAVQRDLAAADGALAAGQFKSAYAYYREAYQTLGGVSASP